MLLVWGIYPHLHVLDLFLLLPHSQFFKNLNASALNSVFTIGIELNREEKYDVMVMQYKIHVMIND